MADDIALDTRAEADATPEKTVRRWLMEIKLAKKREKVWREKAQKVLDVYRGVKRRKNSFNVLWSNTEVLRPALYNSTPKPDVRRRFRQKDILGKAVGEVMERSLTYCVDAYDLDNCLQNDVLDSLLPGRGLSRVRYVPEFKSISAIDGEQTGEPPPPDSRTGRGPRSPSGGDSQAPPQHLEALEAPHKEEAYEGDREEVDYEQALCEHVQWDDFLHGPGKTWEEVQWVSFDHQMTRDDLLEKFPKEIAEKIRLDDVDDAEVNDSRNSEDLQEVFKRALIREIWDKESKKVFFLSESYTKGLIYPKDALDGEPPLALRNFFPVPRPLQLVEDTGTLIPQPLYEQYREQAEELDRLSTRINKIINACRVRFVYDSTLTELQKLMDAGDNEGIPMESALAWMNSGGLDKAIWFMPVEQIARVLKELYVARETCKQVIYEITGISDILRGATDPNETLGAQQLKANSSSLRLQRMQHEVQRYTRDLIRLLAEVIGENFSSQTLAQMTGLKFPTAVQKQQAQLQMQAMQQMQQQQQAPQGPPGQPGQPPQQAQAAVPPKMQEQLQQMLAMPSWDDIMHVLASDMQREYRVDVETDSTVAQSLQQDMEGLREVLTSVVEFWQGVGPAVEAGAVSMDAVKAITMSVVRRARMGLEVEDALESGMQQPKPQSDPKAAAEAAKQQQAQAQQQHDQQLAQRQQAHEEQIAQRQAMFEQQKAQQEQANEEKRMQMEARLEQQRIAYETHAQQQQAQIDASMAQFKALLDSITKIEVAEISADATLSAAQESAAREGVRQ